MKILVSTLLCASALFAADPPSIETLMENGHWRRAREASEANYKAHPNDARANYLMARVWQRFDNVEQTQRYAEAAVKFDSTSKASNAYHRILGEALRDLANDLLKTDASYGYLALARIASIEKDTGKLETLYIKAVEANPKNFDAR